MGGGAIEKTDKTSIAAGLVVVGVLCPLGEGAIEKTDMRSIAMGLVVVCVLLEVSYLAGQSLCFFPIFIC